MKYAAFYGLSRHRVRLESGALISQKYWLARFLTELLGAKHAQNPDKSKIETKSKLEFNGGYVWSLASVDEKRAAIRLNQRCVFKG